MLSSAPLLWCSSWNRLAFLIGVIPWLGAEQLAALREFLVGLGLLLVLSFRPRGLMPEPIPRLAKN